MLEMGFVPWLKSFKPRPTIACDIMRDGCLKTFITLQLIQNELVFFIPCRWHCSCSDTPGSKNSLKTLEITPRALELSKSLNPI